MLKVLDMLRIGPNVQSEDCGLWVRCKTRWPFGGKVVGHLSKVLHLSALGIGCPVVHSAKPRSLTETR